MTKKRSIQINIAKIIFIAIFALSFSSVSLRTFAETPDYRVIPGDRLSVVVWNNQELSGTFELPPDGNLILPPPIGRVKVVGMTVQEIETSLSVALSDLYRDPQVTVSILAFGGFRVHLIGPGINNPNFYNVPIGTTLQEIIDRAGGFTDDADLRKIQLKRQIGDASSDRAKYESRAVDFSQFLRHNRIEENPELKINDRIFVPIMSSEAKHKRSIVLIGAVKNPGSYPIDKPIRLSELLVRAGGTDVSAELSGIKIVENSGTATIPKTVNFTRFLYQATSDANPYIDRGTFVYVPESGQSENDLPKVNIGGRVQSPGTYPIGTESRLIDLLFQAGGLQDDTNIKQIQLVRISENQQVNRYSFDLDKYLKSGDLTQNPLLLPGDTILVPIAKTSREVPVLQSTFIESMTIEIIGRVHKSGIYRVPKDATPLDLIILAGGFPAQADVEHIVLIRGEDAEWIEFDLEEVRTNGRFDLLPVLHDNDTIFVPQREPQQISLWQQSVEFARDFSVVAVLFIMLMRGR